MKHTKIGKDERERIFELFIKKRELRFSEIEKSTGIRSNHLSYHLKEMTKSNFLEKEDDVYRLTKESEKLIPVFAHITGKEQGPLTIIVAAIINKGKICLLKREKRPYQGYWGLIGGKVKLDESIKHTALREAEEETGLKCRFEKVSAVLHERVNDNGTIKHAFVIFLCKLTTNDTKTIETEEGKLDWFSVKNLPFKIIPSDKYMVEQLLNKSGAIKEVLIDEKQNSLENMRIEDGGRL